MAGIVDNRESDTRSWRQPGAITYVFIYHFHISSGARGPELV